jgi:hypothetical protein
MDTDEHLIRARRLDIRLFDGEGLVRMARDCGVDFHL